MKIVLFGYGKLGKTIEQMAVQSNHTIIAKIDSKTTETQIRDWLPLADVAIECSQPEAAVKNILHCFAQHIPVVCGTTGWTAKMDVIKTACKKQQGGFLYASNFSIGVNIFFEINTKLAQLMRALNYTPSIEETHHVQKKDIPSGTAITLAEQILHHQPQWNHWSKNTANEPNSLPITSHRIGTVPGTHTVQYQNEIDTIHLTHTAHNRLGFAQGAVLAAQFMIGKRGVYTMSDVLKT